jgi:sortase A
MAGFLFFPKSVIMDLGNNKKDGKSLVKVKLPLIIIIAGLIFIGIGSWQLIDTKVQTDASIKKAKEIIAHPQKQPGSIIDSDQTKKSGDINKTAAKKKPAAKIGDVIGLLFISKIHAELPIVEGTDADDLRKGVGHYKGSYLPGQKGQIVFSGHRDTVFRNMGKVKIGDTIKVKMPNGTFNYKITHTKIVDSKDTSIITLQHQEEELILTTCYPFRYVGNAPNRYIVYAKPVN